MTHLNNGVLVPFRNQLSVTLRDIVRRRWLDLVAGAALRRVQQYGAAVHHAPIFGMVTHIERNDSFGFVSGRRIWVALGDSDVLFAQLFIGGWSAEACNNFCPTRCYTLCAI